MGRIARELRQREAQRIYAGWPQNGHPPESWLIQSLPSCGGEEVFSSLMTSVKDQNPLTVVCDIGEFTKLPPTSLVAAVIAQLKPGELLDGAPDLTVLLSTLRLFAEDMHIAKKPIVIGLANFDSVLKIQDSEGMQQILNQFQSLGSNARDYGVSFVVQCHRNIEDICHRVNYSDFYKLFQFNHRRIRNALREQLLPLLDPLTPEQAENLIALSGGFPELIEVLLRYNHLTPDELTREGLDALTSVFTQWTESLSQPESEVLQHLVRSKSIPSENLSAFRKLGHKAIVLDRVDPPRIVVPIFELYLRDEMPSVADHSIIPFIRKPAEIGDTHSTIIESLFSGYYFLEWSYLQPPEGDNATVFLIRGEDRKGLRFRPAVVKVDRDDRMAQEIARTERAKELLGPLVPSIVGNSTHKGQRGIRCELATGDGRKYEVRQFAKFYESESSADIRRVLASTFERGLFPLYANIKIEQRKYKAHYFLPRQHAGEYERLSEIFRRSSLYDATTEVVSLSSGRVLKDPGNHLRPQGTGAYQSLFATNRSLGTCFSHGDLNPRNLLIDGIGNIHIIDFSTLKEKDGSRFHDCTRLETEIKFKLMPLHRDHFLDLLALESLLANATRHEVFQQISALPLTETAKKMCSAIEGIRASAITFRVDGEDESDLYFEYRLCLLGQTLRIALFDDYLTEMQQEFAVISSSMLMETLSR